MKSVTFVELDQIVTKINSYRGAVLEDAVLHGETLVLILAVQGKAVFIIIDVGSQKPALLVTESSAPQLKKQMKPLSLYLRAHFLGLKLIDCERMQEFGRWVNIHFADSKGIKFKLELHLFPQARNIIAHTSTSQISLHKRTILKPLQALLEDFHPRSPEEIYSDWQSERSLQKNKTKTASLDQEKSFLEQEKLIDKKQKVFAQLEEKKQELLIVPWQELGDWLKSHRDLDVPEEWAKLVNRKKSLQANIEDVFAKAKQAKSKLAAVEDRLLVLQTEIEKIKAGEWPAGKTVELKAVKTPVKGTKARTFDLGDGVRAYVGKSAADNLQILRQSKAWHLWLHLKDFPGSHGFIAFDKKQSVDLETIRKVALWVLRQSLSDKQRGDWKGVKCIVIYCECRFVTPIRGDRLGRVTYKNEKTLTVVN